MSITAAKIGNTVIYVEKEKGVQTTYIYYDNDKTRVISEPIK